MTMYLKYFNMLRKPFKSTSDPNFYYLTDCARKAYSCITDAIRQRIPYVVLSGEAGTGKTTLLNCLMADDSLPARWILVNHASLSWEDILFTIGKILKIKGTDGNADAMTRKIAVCVKALMEQGFFPVLILDEAQRLTGATLLNVFEWRAGLDTQGVKLTILLSGQSNFTRTLTDSKLSRFTADATVHCRLKGLTPSECREMIASRLETAGYSGRALFSKKTLTAIYQLSGGIPRAVNSICDYGLFMAASHRHRKVSREDIREVSQYMQQKNGNPYLGPLSPGAVSPKSGGHPTLKLRISGVVSQLKNIVPSVGGLFDSRKRAVGGFIENALDLWRPFLRPGFRMWGYGIVCLFIAIGGGYTWLRTPSQPLSPTTADLWAGKGRSVSRFQVTMERVTPDLGPADDTYPTENDIRLALQPVKVPDLETIDVEKRASVTGGVDLPDTLVWLDSTMPGMDAKPVEMVESVEAVHEAADEKRLKIAAAATHLKKQPTPSKSVPAKSVSAKIVRAEIVRVEVDPIQLDPVPPKQVRSDPVRSDKARPIQSLLKKQDLAVSTSPPKSEETFALAHPPPVLFEKPDPGSNALLTAIRTGNIDAVRNALASGSKPDTVFTKDKTALTAAVEEGRVDIAQILLDKGAPIDQPTPRGETALMKAAWAGHVPMVDLLLSRDARIDLRNREGWTPLFYGAIMGRHLIVKTLLDQGAQVDLPDRDGRTPLMAAAWNGHIKIVQRLLAAGAQPNQKDRDGWTPFMFAAFEGHTDVAQALILGGADFLLINDSGQNGAALATHRGHTALNTMISNLTRP
jgi:ankyrin repeat protein/type II secretory pathway predicted ATPase ExeA